MALAQLYIGLPHDILTEVKPEQVILGLITSFNDLERIHSRNLNKIPTH